VKTVPIEPQRERHKVRIGDKLLVILADRGVLISAPAEIKRIRKIAVPAVTVRRILANKPSKWKRRR
jgi:hypothetical protein